MENFAIKFEAKELYNRILWSLEHLFGISHLTRGRIAVPVNIEGKDHTASEAMGKLQLLIKELPYNEIKELNLDLDALRKANKLNCTERTRLLLEFKAENPTYSQLEIDDSLLEIRNDYCDFEKEVNHCIDHIGKLKEDNTTDKKTNK